MTDRSPAIAVDARRTKVRVAAVVVAASALTLVFWLPLWTGGGLVGSDIYAYFLPQKAYFAEQLRAGALPLWNNRVGWGYPQLAESQTGVFYPLNLALYSLLDVNAAFNAAQLIHYGLAFLFAWMYTREVGLSPSGAGLAALVYTYGWFPTRICLEWAIVGGAWLPLALWCVERFLKTRAWRYAIWLPIVLALQMLAGHFTLAFVTQVALVAYVPLRIWLARTEPVPTSENSRRIACGILAAAIASGFLLAAVQLVPTWELKQQSQRQSVTTEHDPAYGYIPPRYLLQTIAPWHWYLDDRPFAEAIAGSSARTNRVEAHLYFGLLPTALAIWSVWLIRRKVDRRLVIWLGLGIAFTIYAIGILMPITKHLPGFSFFEGAGRFGIIPTLAVALWAGVGFDRLIERCRGSARPLAIVLVFGATTLDLWLVSRQTVADPWLAAEFPMLIGPQAKFVYLVETPPLVRLESSPLRRVLAGEAQPVRLFSEGKNLPSMLGVGTLPVYLGLGPAVYFDPRRQLPPEFDFRRSPTVEHLQWFRQSGVSHFLSFVPLEGPAWPVRFVWAGVDPFLNQTLARGRDELLILYRLNDSPGRLAWEGNSPEGSARIAEYNPSHVTIETSSAQTGRLVLTDLRYPGWAVTIDGEPAKPIQTDEVFRAVEVPAGKHVIVWTYRPRSLYWGAGISLVTLIGLLIVGHFRFWHADWFQPKAPQAAMGLK